MNPTTLLLLLDALKRQDAPALSHGTEALCREFNLDPKTLLPDLIRRVLADGPVMVPAKLSRAEARDFTEWLRTGVGFDEAWDRALYGSQPSTSTNPKPSPESA